MPQDRTHRYEPSITWIGDRGEGTRTYRGYDRDHLVEAPGKPPIPGSSDPAFRGDPARWSPEALLVVSLSQCHMLWFLHLASDADVVVTGYRDRPEGLMVESAGGGGRFTQVTLHPEVTVATGGTGGATEPAAPADATALAARLAPLHERAHELCYIASSVNFPVHCEPADPALAPATGPVPTP